MLYGVVEGYLPRPGLTWLHAAEAGEWTAYEVAEVTIPAVAGLQNGVWYRICEGVRGRNAESRGVTPAYVIVEPASYYYRIMTRCDRMPCLVRERM